MSLYYSSLEAKMARQRKETLMELENQQLQLEALTIANQRNKFQSQAAEVSLRNARAISNVVSEAVDLAVSKTQPDFEISQIDKSDPSHEKTIAFLTRLGIDRGLHSAAILSAASKIRAKTLHSKYSTFYKELKTQKRYTQGDFNKVLASLQETYEFMPVPIRKNFNSKKEFDAAVEVFEKHNDRLEKIIERNAGSEPKSEEAE